MAATETLMQNIPAGQLWGISLHYYIFPGGSFAKKGSAASFDEAEYFGSFKKALYLDEIAQAYRSGG